MFAQPRRQHHFDISTAYSEEQQTLFPFGAALARANLQQKQSTHASPSRRPQSLLPISIPLSTNSAESTIRDNDMSEHMLRRKTPNGTLPAGYDGTSVEWGPNKRLMGVAEPQRHFFPQSPIVQPEPQQFPLDTPSRATFGFASNLSTPNQIWLPGNTGPQSLDSLLYQGAQPIPNHQHPIYQVPYVAQPGFWPPSHPLTVSNAQPRFGPYWPDGSFEPFRPSAFLDSHLSMPWTNDTMLDSQSYPAFPPSISPQNTFHGWNAIGASPLHSPHDPRAGFPRHISDTDIIAHPADNPRNVNLRAFQNQISPPTASQWSPASIPHSFSASVEGSNAEFKSRVLFYAHRTHANLLEIRRQSLPKSNKHHVSRSMKRSAIGTRENPAHQQQQTPRVQIAPFHVQPQEMRSFADRVHLGIGNTNHPSRDTQSLSSPVDYHKPQQPLLHNSSLTNTPLNNAKQEAENALRILDGICSTSDWTWTDGILLGGCLAYGLEHFDHALQWYDRVLRVEPDNVEALSNAAAAFNALKRRKEAETYWYRAIKLRPNHWEAVEHLVGLLCQEQRPHDAVNLIQSVERAIQTPHQIKLPTDESQTPSFNADRGMMQLSLSPNQRSVYNIPPAENGRLVALIHAKGNMLYALGDNTGASRAFEEAVLLVCGQRFTGISALIKHILAVFGQYIISHRPDGNTQLAPFESTLLPPLIALETKKLVFKPSGQLPGLRDVPIHLQSTAVLYASNSLLSLAKIYQDGMSSGATVPQAGGVMPGVQDILALYYLSLSLQPSPSTANNVGILLAGVQQTVQPKYLSQLPHQGETSVPGVVHGSGVAFALAYYNYGLSLDNKHAHLYTNLGSLLKDIGQLGAAIRMYESAVSCDANFDIALANLANAVKDQGRISDAINYYRRAVKSSPDFPEAVCGLANALNSVCNWKGRGGIVFSNSKHDRWHVDEEGMLIDARQRSTNTSGWICRVLAIVEKQLEDGKSWGKGTTRRPDFSQLISRTNLAGNMLCDQNVQNKIVEAVASWTDQAWEGAKVVRLVERATRQLGWQMYQERYIKKVESPVTYQRPRLPTSLTVPGAPTVLPFHTFTYPLTANQIRKISQRNGLRISCSTLKAPWLPNVIFTPPAPPEPCLRVGYVSSDFNNHPLAHLMQSVFGFHNPSRVKAICYATTPSDNSIHREQIQRESPVFYDASAWSIDRLVKQIVSDGIHILVNLNGYTRGARNEVFAARPAPIQMSFMGFAGTLGAEWCDYLLADDIAIPPSMLRPYRGNVSLLDQAKDNNHRDDDGSDWVYGENIIFAKETFFCCDHRQSAPDAREDKLLWEEEKKRRQQMRKELFPDLEDDTIILGNFNQLYKIDPTTFRCWLRILQAIPKAVLWLLRFPDLGEQNLREAAAQWSAPSVAKRIMFTDVAPKHQHIARARICDLFLDTPECNAHTTAADVLWSGTPLLTLPRYEYKMCSRMAASILRGALPRGSQGDAAAKDLTASNEEDYEAKAIELGTGLALVLTGRQESCRLLELRRMLYEGRWTSALFDTRRWVRDLEDAYDEAWRKWVAGEAGDIWLKDVIEKNKL